LRDFQQVASGTIIKLDNLEAIEVEMTSLTNVVRETLDDMLPADPKEYFRDRLYIQTLRETKTTDPLKLHWEDMSDVDFDWKYALLKKLNKTMQVSEAYNIRNQAGKVKITGVHTQKVKQITVTPVMVEEDTDDLVDDVEEILSIDLSAYDVEFLGKPKRTVELEKETKLKFAGPWMTQQLKKLFNELKITKVDEASASVTDWMGHFICGKATMKDLYELLETVVEGGVNGKGAGFRNAVRKFWGPLQKRDTLEFLQFHNTELVGLQSSE
jgi:hypothetical protein